MAMGAYSLGSELLVLFNAVAQHSLCVSVGHLGCNMMWTCT
jgi:hypothetical protein